jgi:RimJ/RimL family protein N-acetyltransferase
MDYDQPKFGWRYLAMIEYQIHPITREQAERIITWSYQPPYGVYDLNPDDIKGLLNPEYRYHQVMDQEGNLVGYCCYGSDAQVPGGDYSAGEPDVLDVGVGMRPDLTGQGQGGKFISAILEYAWRIYRPEVFRVTVADFNQRSLNTFRKLGFEETHHFVREMGQLPFTQLEMNASF